MNQLRDKDAIPYEETFNGKELVIVFLPHYCHVCG